MADKDFQLRIITPERVFYEGTVDMVEFNTTEGQIGVLPGHIPLTVIVKPGILHITEKDGEKEAALHSGFAEILPEGVTILAEIIEWPNEIDENRAEAALHRAEDTGDGYCQSRDGIAESNGENSGVAIIFATPVFHFMGNTCIFYKKA